MIRRGTGFGAAVDARIGNDGQDRAGAFDAQWLHFDVAADLHNEQSATRADLSRTSSTVIRSHAKVRWQRRAVIATVNTRPVATCHPAS